MWIGIADCLNTFNRVKNRKINKMKVMLHQASHSSVIDSSRLARKYEVALS